MGWVRVRVRVREDRVGKLRMCVFCSGSKGREAEGRASRGSQGTWQHERSRSGGTASEQAQRAMNAVNHTGWKWCAV